MFNAQELQDLKKVLSTPKKISIIPHRNPDGDAMGSTLALCHFLRTLDHQVVVVAPNEFPDFLSWLPGANKVLVFERENDRVKKEIESSKLIFTLDFNALHRTGDVMGAYLATLNIPMAMIDHHQTPDDYATYTFSDVAYGSTCEMVYDFINALGYNKSIDKDIATCIYTGITTDSGGFRYPKTTGATHRAVADLIDKGIHNSEIHNLLFDNSSMNRLKILGLALHNLVVLPEYKTSYITLTQDELDSANNQKGDTEGIVNYGLSIKGIDFAVIFIENKEEGIIKISFRSQGDFDVNQFARLHFQGGGHINAAGGKSILSLADTTKKFIAILASEKI
ncbi:bifunctional oligoribonuclease/PAP phosphatase NrnA [uncultured Flavobacterium sp.]|uniref:DHH family phosphoesterase n=1 Tax=uncultured Flavobacterium sp. TaxID=165435 RepID=UPI0030CA2DBF